MSRSTVFASDLARDELRDREAEGMAHARDGGRRRAARRPLNPHNKRRARYSGSMSQENVDKTLDYIDAYNRRDFDAAVRHFHPDVDWVLPELQAADSAKGPAAIIRFWDGLDDTFDELQLKPQEVIDAGDRVAVRLRHYARGKESGLAIEDELYHQVTTFRDGVMVRIEYVESWPEALAAARVEG
jgi:ketosteroid isomerase-like protein